MHLLYLKFGSFILIQFSLQKLLGYLDFTLEAIWILIALIGFEGVLTGSLSVRASRAGLPLFAEHHGVPQLQPLEQTAVRKLQQHIKAPNVSVRERRNVGLQESLATFTDSLFQGCSNKDCTRQKPTKKKNITHDCQL